MERIESVEGCVGKTIAAFQLDGTREFVGLRFADGSYFTAAVYGTSFGDINVEVDEVCDWALTELGVISREECDRRLAAMDEAAALGREKREKEELARLKAKYEAAATE